LGVSPDGSKVFVTGASHATGGTWDTDYATLAYDAAKGTKIWLKRYNPGDGGGVHFATALGVTPDGTRFTQAAAL
jgi:hypothetical protein